MKEKLAEVNESYSIYHEQTVRERLLCMQLNEEELKTLLNNIADTCELLRGNIS